MACVGQGALYVGGAVGALRVMAARAEIKRRGVRGPEAADQPEPVEAADRT
jgi:hypothetical protein